MAFLYIGWWGGTVYIVSLGVCASRDNAGLVRPSRRYIVVVRTRHCYSIRLGPTAAPRSSLHTPPRPPFARPQGPGYPPQGPGPHLRTPRKRAPRTSRPPRGRGGGTGRRIGRRRTPHAGNEKKTRNSGFGAGLPEPGSGERSAAEERANARPPHRLGARDIGVTKRPGDRYPRPPPIAR